MKNPKTIILSIVIVFCVLMNPGCKKTDDYDITGIWNITIIALELDRTLSITFTGSKASGTITLYERNGEYSVNGDSVTFRISYWDREWGSVNEIYSGKFDDEKTETGTWQAVR